MRLHLPQLLAFLCAQTAGGWVLAQPPIEAPANTMCPVLPDEPVDRNFSTLYHGKSVYFCCKRCLAKFTADPTPYVVNLPQFAIDSNHDHADHAPHLHGWKMWLAYIGRFHVMTIHFPIVLVITATIFEMWAWRRRSPAAYAMVRPLVGLGAVAAVLAMLLGLANSIEADYSGTLGWVFWWHRALGITTAVLAVAALAAVEYRHRRPSPGSMALARLILTSVAVVTGITGHFGGSLVFGWDYLIP